MAKLANLEELQARSINLENYETLSKLNNLRILEITDSFLPIKALSYIPTSVEKLSIRNCGGLKDLNSLSKLTKLKHLELSNCWISDITPIGELRQLKSLSLDNNLISDLSSLSDLVELENLSVKNNRITSLHPLEPLYSRKLSSVIIDYNPITDYSFLNNKHCRFSSSDTNEELNQALSVAKAMVKELIKPGMTDEEKYAALAYGLCRKAEYNRYLSGIYYVLVNGKGYGDGYAGAYMMLCTLAGLPCYYAHGIGNYADTHSWNIVNVGGKYYNVDSMLIDSPEYDNDSGYINTTCFLKSEKYFIDKDYRFDIKAPDLICDNTSKDELIGQIRIPLE